MECTHDFVETPAVLRWLLQTSTMPLLLIPGFDDVDPRLTHGPHFVGLPGDRENPQPAWSQLALDEPLPWRDVEKMLRRPASSRGAPSGSPKSTRAAPAPPALTRSARAAPVGGARGTRRARDDARALAWRPDVARLMPEPCGPSARTQVALHCLCTRLRTATEAPIRSHEGVYSWATPA